MRIPAVIPVEVDWPAVVEDLAEYYGSLGAITAALSTLGLDLHYTTLSNYRSASTIQYRGPAWEIGAALLNLLIEEYNHDPNRADGHNPPLRYRSAGNSRREAADQRLRTKPYDRVTGFASGGEAIQHALSRMRPPIQGKR